MLRLKDYNHRNSEKQFSTKTMNFSGILFCYHPSQKQNKKKILCNSQPCLIELLIIRRSYKILGQTCLIGTSKELNKTRQVDGMMATELLSINILWYSYFNSLSHPLHQRDGNLQNGSQEGGNVHKRKKNFL